MLKHQVAEPVQQLCGVVDPSTASATTMTAALNMIGMYNALCLLTSAPLVDLLGDWATGEMRGANDGSGWNGCARQAGSLQPGRVHVRLAAGLLPPCALAVPNCPKLPPPPASPALEHDFLLPAARSILDLQIALQPNDVFQPAQMMLAKVPRPAGAVDVEAWGVVAAEAEARRATDAAVRQAAAMVTIMEDVAQLKEMLG